MGDIWACLISFFFLIALVGIIVYELASPAAEPLAMEVNSEKQTIKEERSPEPDTEKQSIKGERSPELVSLEIDNLFGFLAPSRRYTHSSSSLNSIIQTLRVLLYVKYEHVCATASSLLDQGSFSG
ncbi:Uncharacterized protein Rs2_11235 [Raphanus sativus]|nr:Uncharacterized protein Rs2_11235 [Raphanus sativus]